MTFFRKILTLLLFLSAGVSGAAWAETTGPVVIGAYVNGIRAVDLKAGSVNLDVYLWFRTKSPRDLLASVEIMNGVSSEKTSVVRKSVGSDNYSSARMQLTAYQVFDLKKFPLDSQTLQIIIEDCEEDVSQLQFIADTENTKVLRSIVLPGWKIGQPRISVVPNTYETNYGDPSMGTAHSVFSRTILEIPIEREGIGYFFKLLGTVLLSACVAFLSFYIKPDDLDPRFGLGVGGIFAVVASNFVLSALLPETHLITMAEALLLLTIVGIFVALVESVVALKLWENDRKAAALALDSRCGIWVPVLYFCACAIIILSYSMDWT